MPIGTERIVTFIEEFAPPARQEPWDNTGWQINLCSGDISKVLVALEVTSEVIAEAKEVGAELILTHHPLLFSPVKVIDKNTVKGRYIAELIKCGISVYSAHTSFDSAQYGMNDTLAELMGLINVSPYPPIGNGNAWEQTSQIMRVGELESPTKFGDIIKIAETAFDMQRRLKVVGDPDRLIKRVAVCGGGGGDFIESMLGSEIDLYITSDVKHHEAQFAREGGLALIDGGHNGTEKHFVQVVSERLIHEFGDDITIIETSHSADPFTLLK